jgi:hypothetical protein
MIGSFRPPLHDTLLNSPFPLRRGRRSAAAEEGGPRPAFSPAVAGRMRGSFPVFLSNARHENLHVVAKNRR